MILKFKRGASQHGFANPAEACAAGKSFAVITRSGLPAQVGLPFDLDGKKGSSFLYATDLWKMDDIGEIDCVFVDEERVGSDRKPDLPPDHQKLLYALGSARDAMIETRRSVAKASPADRGAAMVIAAIDGYGAFLAAAASKQRQTI